MFLHRIIEAGFFNAPAAVEKQGLAAVFLDHLAQAGNLAFAKVDGGGNRVDKIVHTENLLYFYQFLMQHK